jgi:hypothetical protein
MANKGMCLLTLKKELQTEIRKLDKFFDRFLEDHSGRLSLEKLDTPEWKLYRAKMKEYQKYDEAIDLINFYTKKENVQVA